MATIHKNLSEQGDNIASAEGMKIALVVAEWNAEITEGLKKGAVETLNKQGIYDRDLSIHYVPGCFELPLGAQTILEKGEVDAVICIGCVIQGETKHFDYVCEGTTYGIQKVALKYNKPVVFCVLTDNTIEQSRARSGGKHGNKGVEAAVTAIKMIAFQK
ncbi:MAG: 6,7-dimethyl-8-ribityllumazine synthase [Flavobacteriales bacterium]